MKMKLALLMAAALALPFASPATAFHGQTCSAAGATPLTDPSGAGVFAFAETPTPANGFGTLPGTTYNPIKHTVSLAAGEHYLVGAQVGDVDMVVCVPGALQNKHACAMGNVMPVPESCLLSVPGNPGSGTPIVCAGPANCDYVIYIFYCSGVECAYPADVPSTGIVAAIV